MSKWVKGKRLVDGNGRPVPKRLLPVFEAKERILNHVEEIARWQSVLDTRQHLFERVGIPSIKLHRILVQMERDVLDNLPYLICECGSDSECPKCNGKGWQSKRELSPTGMFALPDDSSNEAPQTTTSPSVVN